MSVGLSGSQAKLLELIVRKDPDQTIEDNALLIAVKRQSVHCIEGYLLHRYATLALMDHGLLLKRFSNLFLLVEREGDLARRVDPFASLSSMLNALPEEDGWVILGSPGSGKSTLLLQHEMSEIECFFRSGNSLRLGSNSHEDELAIKPTICIYERLADYSLAAGEPETWLSSRWRSAFPRLPALDSLRDSYNLRFLLDGINEIGVRKEQYQDAVRKFADWSRTYVSRQSPPVFSIRTRDYSVRLDTRYGLRFQAAHIREWDSNEIKSFCIKRLGKDGEKMWEMLKSSPGNELLRLCGNAFNLEVQCALFQMLGRPARLRAELLGGVIWMRLRRELCNETRTNFLKLDVLDETDLCQVFDETYWRENLARLPASGLLVRVLELQAIGMQESSSGCSERASIDSITQLIPQTNRRKRWLRGVQSINIAEVDQARGVFEFKHQLWREFFVASHLAFRGDLLLNSINFSPSPLPEMPIYEEDQLQLPTRRLSNWQVPLGIAIQIVSADVAQRIIRKLMNDGNFVLAGNVASLRRTMTGEIDLPEDLTFHIKTKLLDDSEKLEDIRERVEASEALGELGDSIRYEHGNQYCVPKDHLWIKIPTIERVRVAFFPVTNMEYCRFIEDSGYSNNEWWTDPHAKSWRDGTADVSDMYDFWRPIFDRLRNNPLESINAEFPFFTSHYLKKISIAARWNAEEAEDWMQREFGGGKSVPAHWTNSSFNKPLQPVVGVCLYEARAYCAWLSAKLGRNLRLPTKEEWTIAATGAGKRRWPWKTDTVPHRFQINAEPAALQRTSPPGVFPDGTTPEGICDLSGNIWEWTCSLHEAYDVPSSDYFSDKFPAWAVLGGAWEYPVSFCHPSGSSGALAFGRDNLLGFRLVEDI